MAYFISDQLNLNKEKLEIAASVSKSDLVSGLVGEFPELQGVMGKYFASKQGFEDDVARAISEHYLPISISSLIFFSFRIFFILSLKNMIKSFFVSLFNSFTP